MKPKKEYMRLALCQAEVNLKSKEGGPFGACIVKGNKVIALARNRVLCSDATSHAEINAIRKASRRLGRFDLSGCVIYSTTEPCPMCFSAIHWARIDAVVYGTSIRDAVEVGFNELRIDSKSLKKLGKSRVKLFGGFLLPECKSVMQRWDKQKDKRLY